MEYTLEFIVMAETSLDYSVFLSLVKSFFQDLREVKYRSFIANGNFFEITKNKEWAPSLVDDEVEGYFYMKYRIESTPKKSISESEQISLARYLSDQLNKSQVENVVCSNFEDKL